MAIRTHAVEDSYDSLSDHLFSRIDEISHRRYYRFSRTPAWRPAINVYEDAQCFHICAELAGMRKDEIHVETCGRRITIYGERPVPVPPDNPCPDCVLRMEIDSGRFEQAVELPDLADLDSTRARLIDGLLWITVAKRVP